MAAAEARTSSEAGDMDVEIVASEDAADEDDDDDRNLSLIHI